MNNIQNDLLYCVMQYLEPRDLARLSSTCKKLRDEHEEISKLLWWDHLAQKWGFEVEFMKRYFPEMRTRNMRTIYPSASRMVKGLSSDHLDIEFQTDSMTARFLGRVGESNRSVQGDICYPARKERPVDTGRSSFIEGMMSFASKMASEFLKECELSEFEMDDVEDDSDVVRHSVPFARKLYNGETQFYIKPRFVSYYEVRVEGSPHSSAEGSECVAVGLATKSFMKSKRLPGWDNESFGYHGDDGAIFHGRGRQLSEFGPKYGCNDTVGCGLNHKDNSIFFTLNGKLLGTAFKDVPCDVDLYPTVGIDTNCPVRFNFGMEPFQFDLVTYLESLES